MHSSLIDTATLAAHLGDADWVVVDCRFDLANPAAGRAQYAEGHVAGARYFSLDDDLSGAKTGRNGRHPLPAPDVFASRLGAAGIGNATQVVAYDASGSMYAARLWWMLRWLGHEAVAVLDGGYGAWTSEGRAVTREVPAITPAHFAPNVRHAPADAAELLRRLADGAPHVVDARAADRYRGENETIDPVGGHIPGAMHRFFRDNLAADGRFKPRQDLRLEWEELLGSVVPASIVHQCGSGVSACVNLLAMEVAGLPGSRLYPGSWSEWCADPARPMRTGAVP